jgi:hypothetical protein
MKKILYVLGFFVLISLNSCYMEAGGHGGRGGHRAGHGHHGHGAGARVYAR